MSELSDKKCVPCSEGASLLSDEQLDELNANVDKWSIVDIDGVDHLIRIFPFKNFKDAIAFTNEIAELAESENHHPAIMTEWGSVEVLWWTQKINGLHENDFIMASKTDLLYDKHE